MFGLPIIVRIFVAVMVIGFTQRIRTVSEGAVPGVDLFQLQINVSSMRPAEISVVVSGTIFSNISKVSPYYRSLPHTL